MKTKAIITKIILISSFCFGAFNAYAQNAELILKANPSISGPSVTIGDIFDNAGSLASRKIANAPQGNNGLVFSSSALQARMASFGLTWANPEKVPQVILGNVNEKRMLTSEPSKTQIANTQAANANGASREIAVLNQDIARGTAITSQMISWANIADSSGAIEDASILIGSIAKKNINSQTAIKSNDLEAKIAVRRGQEITIIHQTGGLKITMRGKAMSNGDVGQTIKVVNSTTNKTIDAVVENDGVARAINQFSASR